MNTVIMTMNWIDDHSCYDYIPHCKDVFFFSQSKRKRHWFGDIVDQAPLDSSHSFHEPFLVFLFKIDP